MLPASEGLDAPHATTGNDVLISAIAGLLAGGLAFLAYRTQGPFLLPLATIAVACLLVALRQSDLTNGIELGTDRFEAYVVARSGRPGKIAIFIFRPIGFCARELVHLTSRIDDPHIRAGVRFAVMAVTVEVVVITVVLAVVLIIGLIFFLIIAYLTWWILSLAGHAPRPPTGATPLRFSGTSRKQKPLFGDAYEEFRDKDGDISHTAHRRKDFLGKEYVEYQNPEGEVIGRSDQEETLMGDKYQAIRDNDGTLVGTKEVKEPLFGDKFVETKDADGNVIGETHNIDPLIGERYREHREP